jgi:hypothetical protein
MDYSYGKFSALDEACNHILRAKGIVGLVADAHPGREHENLMSAMWAVEIELGHAIKLVEGSYGQTEEPSIRYDLGEMVDALEDINREGDRSSLDEEDYEAAEEDGDDIETRVFTSSPLLIDVLPSNAYHVEVLETHPNGEVTIALSASKKDMDSLFGALVVMLLRNATTDK